MSEEEIHINEYVRNEDGYIQKINIFDKQTNIFKDENGNLRIWEGEDVYGNEYSSLITKHSKNIIDLIEVGDFVNGIMVYEILNDKIKLLSGEINKKRIHLLTGHLLEGKDIKSILTKEQYNVNCYKVVE